jgi:hypothetical protein
LVPTWRISRRGAGSISKRLDRFYVIEDLLAGVCRYKSWVDFPYFSNHAPVLLRLERLMRLTVYPFKFNVDWLQEAEVTSLLKEVLEDIALHEERDIQHRFVNKLNLLKKHLKVWEKEFKRKHEERLVLLEGQLKELLMDAALGSNNCDRDLHIKRLEVECDKLLQAEEEKW